MALAYGKSQVVTTSRWGYSSLVEGFLPFTEMP